MHVLSQISTLGGGEVRLPDACLFNLKSTMLSCFRGRDRPTQTLRLLRNSWRRFTGLPLEAWLLYVVTFDVQEATRMASASLDSIINFMHEHRDHLPRSPTLIAVKQILLEQYGTCDTACLVSFAEDSQASH